MSGADIFIMAVVIVIALAAMETIFFLGDRSGRSGKHH